MAVAVENHYNYSMRYALAFLIVPAMALASPAEEPPERNIPILDTTQELLGGRANIVANRLDLFFADQRADDELARSRIRIRQQYEVRERSLPKDDTQIRFNLRLPHLEKRFQFESQDEKDKKKKVTTQDVVHNELNKKWQFRADVGVNASIPPRVLVRNRLRKNFQTGELIHRFVEELSWYSDRDWEQNTTLDTDLSFADHLLLRFRNAIDWEITRKNFRTSHGPAFFQRLNEKEALSYSANFSTEVDDGVWFVNNYRLSLTYRRDIYKKWLYIDLVPGLDFPKLWSFRRTPFLMVQLEALFGGY